jgi:hypothetical protein
MRPIWRKAPVAWSRYCIGDFTITDDDTGSLLRGAISTSGSGSRAGGR